jgi:hypothetical protein
MVMWPFLIREGLPKRSADCCFWPMIEAAERVVSQRLQCVQSGGPRGYLRATGISVKPSARRRGAASASRNLGRTFVATAGDRIATKGDLPRFLPSAAASSVLPSVGLSNVSDWRRTRSHKKATPREQEGSDHRRNHSGERIALFPDAAGSHR